MMKPFRGLAAVATLLALLSTAACGGASEGTGVAAAESSASTAPSHEASTPAEPEYRTEFNDVDPVIKPSAVDRFGEQGVQRALAAALDMVTMFTYDEDIATISKKRHPGQVKAALLKLEPRLSFDAAMEWRKDVETALANGGDGTDAYDDVFAFVTFGFNTDAVKKKHGDVWKWQFAPLFINPTIDSAVVSYTPKFPAYARIQVKSHVDVRESKNDKPMLQRISRNQQLWAIRENGRWKIWLGRATWRFHGPRPAA